MPRQKCFTVYKYSELSPKAKETARQWYIENSFDHDWYDSTYAEYKERLTALGFNDPKFSFSGFWCQGDGASFTCDRVDIETYIKDKPKYRRLKAVLDAGHLTAKVIRTGNHYAHENTCRVDFGNSLPWERYPLLDALITALQQDMESDRYRLSRELYKALEADYSGQTSEESIAEIMAINDYEFYENGKIA